MPFVVFHNFTLKSEDPLAKISVLTSLNPKTVLLWPTNVNFVVFVVKFQNRIVKSALELANKSVRIKVKSCTLFLCPTKEVTTLPVFML